MWYKVQDQQVSLKIFVKPNAKRTALVDVNEEQGAVISLHAKPQEGAANQELIRFLAVLFDLPKSQINLLRGEQSRYKNVCVPLTAVAQLLIANPQQFLLQHTKS